MRNDQFVDEQIQRTRRTVKMVDVASALLVLASGFLGLLLLAVVLEHWIVPGGLNLIARSVLFAGGLAGGGWFVWRRLWPFVVGNVNPLYAAQQIEEHHPSLKNSLLNLLLLNRPGSRVSPAVMQTLKQQAAQRLNKVSNETAVDRSQLINMAAVFATLVVLFTLYKVLSPKDPLITASRVLMPWTDVMAPSRVTFENIEPGTTTVMRGDVLSPSALIRGLQDDEKAVLRFTTDDGQASQQPIAMHSSDNLHFECRLPADPKSTATSSVTGVQRNLRYYLQAGDARSREFRITVVSAPTISVTSVDYDYPDYTGYLDQQNVPLGDLRGIEGTTVTIHARSNEPIEEAHLDFEADGRRDLALTHSDQTAKVAFKLALRPDRRTPKHSSYALRLTAAGGRQNRNPAQHSIEVLADQSPEVELLAPRPDPRNAVRDVRLNETVTIELEARDPDFALSEVMVLGEVDGRRVLEEKLLEGKHRGRFAGRFRFLPTRHGLQEGDVVQYWAVARDNRTQNRTPSANAASTDRQRFRIVSPDPNRPEDDNAMAQREQNESGEAGQQSGEGESEPNESGQGESEQGQSGAGQSGENESEQNEEGSQSEGESDQGEGMGQDSEGEGKQSGDQSGAGQSGSEQTSSGDNQSGEGNSGQNQSGQQSDGNQQREGEPSGGENSNGQSNQRQEGQNSSGQRDSSPVSSDGDNDAEAFDRIADHLAEQDQNSDSQGKQQNNSQSGKESGAQSENRSGNPQESDSGEQNSEQSDGQQSDAGDKESSQSSEDGSESNSPMGQESTTTGPAGKGNQSNEKTGEPQSDGDPQEDEEWEQNPSGKEQPDGKDTKSTDPGKRKNDTAGEQGGDQPEGGAKTNDNESPHDGTGDTGQNQSADEGSGESSERGTGNNSSSGGNSQQADRPTGHSSEDTPGKGSEVREGRGKKSGRAPRNEDPNPNQSPKRERPENSEGSNQENNNGKSGQGKQTESGQNSEGQDGNRQDSKESEPSDQTGDHEGSTGDGTSEGEGRPGNRKMPPDAADGIEPGGDKVNLEYARKKTDLILDKLGDMLRKKQIDDELLDKLGWTEEDMRRFVSRWQSRKARAEGSGTDANQSQRELDDALRSLGLKPTGPTARSTTARDNQRDFREGVRVPVPPEFQRRLKMYHEGVSKPRAE